MAGVEAVMTYAVTVRKLDQCNWR